MEALKVYRPRISSIIAKVKQKIKCIHLRCEELSSIIVITLLTKLDNNYFK